MSANSSPRWKNCRGNPLFTVRIERSRDDPRHSAVLTGVSTSLDTNGHGIFDMTDLFSKFDPLIQQRADLLATGVTDPFNLVMEKVLSPTVAICNGRETILLGTYNYMGKIGRASCRERVCQDV